MNAEFKKVDFSKRLGKYATSEEAVKAKNESLIATLKKLDVKVISK